MNYNNFPAWHNDKFCTVQDLNVSILDLGLIHSDATYDVMAFRNNKGLAVEQHIDRFFDSCQHWRIPVPYTKQYLLDIVYKIHHKTDIDDSIVWISVTRGVPVNNARDLESCLPQVMIYAKPYTKFNGTNLVTVCESATVVRVPDSAIDQQHKNFVWPDLTRAQWEAIDRGYDTALVFGTTGYLSEGPGFNVAVIKNNQVITPRINRLPGISMQLIEQACQELDIDFAWDYITREQANDCDDMFLTTTIGNIVTVTNYNGRQLVTGRIQQQLIDWFDTYGT
jgi:branched-chain amino acid aminotransferase